MDGVLQKIEDMRLLRAKFRGMAHLIEQLGYDDAPPTDKFEIYYGISMILNDITGAFDRDLDILEKKLHSETKRRTAPRETSDLNEKP